MISTHEHYNRILDQNCVCMKSTIIVIHVQKDEYAQELIQITNFDEISTYLRT